MDLIIRANYKEGREEMCEALNELFADKLMEREQLGIQKGRDQLLQRQINKKLEKGKKPEIIAEELEVPVKTIMKYLS